MIWNLDTTHANVDFSVKHMAISTVRGSFNLFSASGETDDATGMPTALSMEIDATSVNTNNEQRDGHLKSPDFFDVAKFPEITFASKRVVAKGGGQFDIVGDLTMHGVTKEVTAPARTLFYEGGRGRFKGSFMVNRREYGINYDSRMNPIQDVVEVQFELSIVEKKQG